MDLSSEKPTLKSIYGPLTWPLWSSNPNHKPAKFTTVIGKLLSTKVSIKQSWYIRNCMVRNLLPPGIKSSLLMLQGLVPNLSSDLHCVIHYLPRVESFVLALSQMVSVHFIGKRKRKNTFYLCVTLLKNFGKVSLDG